MSHEGRVFGETPFEYSKLITCIFIGGLTEEQIALKLQNDSAFPLMKCLFCFPQSESQAMNQVPFEFLYPNEQYELSAPKYFSMTFTNEKGIRSYVYCFKLTENYQAEHGLKTSLPLVIGIKSYKPDINAFKDLFEKIYQIMNREEPHYANYLSDEVFNYKKVELLNLLAFCTEIVKPSPHTNVRLLFNRRKSEDKSVMRRIDFYFSSNCEIPCNRNDSDINILFAILDLEIIIKLVISILSEKQILIIASDAPMLFNIFPALLKLIFPFKWIHAYLPLLPRDQFEFLQAPVSYLIGILSRHKETPEIKDLIETNEDRVIVDCDSNQIFGYVEYPSYIFRPIDNMNLSERLLYLEKSEVYGYDLSKKAKAPLTFPSDMSKLIIDCENNKMFFDKQREDTFDEDWNSLRQKLQLVKNPNIFNLDDFSSYRKNTEIKIGDIKVNRPFSYNVQSIFLNFFHLKINKYKEEIDDRLINSIRATNLFENFIESAVYQSDSGGIIFKNIFEEKEEKYIKNSFKVSYVFSEFPVKALKDKLKEKGIEVTEAVEKVLNDYARVRGNVVASEASEKKFNFAFLVPSPSKKAMTHKKNAKSLLQKSHEMNPIHFHQLNEESKGISSFRFYNKNGFIQFVNEFLNVFTQSKLSFMLFCYQSQILSDIISSISKELEEIRVTDMQKEEIKPNPQSQQPPQSQLNSIQEKEEEIGDFARSSFRLTKGNCSAGMNIQFEEDNGKVLLDFKEDSSKATYLLFLAHCLENIPETYSLLLDKYNLNANVNEVILQLYLKGYSLNKKEFPLFRFNLFIERYLSDFPIVSSDSDNPIPLQYKDLHQIAFLAIRRRKEEAEFKAKMSLMQEETEANSNLSLINAKEASSFIHNWTFVDSDTLSQSKISNSMPSQDSKANNFLQKVIINNRAEFNPQAMPVSYNIITQMAQMISGLPIDSNLLKTPETVLTQFSDVIANDSVKELVAELADVDLSALKHTGDKIAFWLNCYNYLLLFTLFYKKWAITKEKGWKLFFKNVYYIIGGCEVSFVDIQFIILGKVLFFGEDLKPSEVIKPFYVGRIENWRLLAFLFYLPTGMTLGPKMVTSADFKKERFIVDHFKEYLEKFVKVDHMQGIIYLPDLLSYSDEKWMEKLAKVIPEDIALVLKSKKKKKIVNITWSLDFSYLNS